jgi:hypothetical protein
MKLTNKFFRTKVLSSDDASLIVEHFISTDCVDRSGDVMDPEGMRLDGTPSVLKQHGKDPDTGGEPIAKCLSIRIGVDPDGHKGLIARTQYYDGSQLTPPDNTGRRLFEKAKGGFMPYWSIGFYPEKSTPNTHGGRNITVWPLYEYSQVGVPDNVTAKALETMTLEQFNSLGSGSVLQCTIEKAAEPPAPAVVMTTETPVVLPATVEPVVIELPTILDVKSLTERVATQVPYQAISTIFYAFCDELFMNTKDEKTCRRLVKEFAGLIEPHAVAIALELAALTPADGKAYREKAQALLTPAPTPAPAAAPVPAQAVPVAATPPAPVAPPPQFLAGKDFHLHAMLPTPAATERKPVTVADVQRLAQEVAHANLSNELNKQKGRLD